MEDLGEDCKVDDDYSSTKQMSRVTWMLDKGIWLGKKAVITGAVISSAPLVLPPLVVFSALGLACSVPFGFVFATYACTQKIMSKLLPTPVLSSVLEYNKDGMEVIDLGQGTGAEEEGYDLEDVDLGRGAVEQENDDLLERVDEQGYVEEGNDSVQRAEEQGYEEDGEEDVDLGQAPEGEEMKDTPAEVKEGDILQEKSIDTTGFFVSTIELDRRNEVLPEGAAFLQEDVLYGQDGEEQEMKDTPAEVKEGDILQEKPIDTTGFFVTTIELDRRNEVLPEGAAFLQEDVLYGQDGEEQEMKDTPAEVKEGDILQEKPIDTTGFFVTTIELDRRNEVLPEGAGFFQEDVRYGQDGEEQEMKDTPAEVKGDILQEKPIDTTGFVVTTIELDRRNEVLPEGAAFFQEDVLNGQDGMQIYSEETVEQEKLMLDVVIETGMKIVLDDAITSTDFHEQKPVVEEKQLKEVVEGAATILELNVNDIREPKIGDSYQAHVYDGKNDFAVRKTGSDEMKRDIPMRNVMDGEAKNGTQEGSTSQENETLVHNSLEERPIKIIEHGHEREYKEDTTKYIQVEDVLSVEGTEVRNENPIIEGMKYKPLIGMRKVIVSVQGGKNTAREQENEDIKECNKSQKLVLMAKKVTEQTDGDKTSVVERTTAGDLNSAREIADECGLDLFDYTAGDHDSNHGFNISEENDNIRSSKTGDVADLPVLRVSTKAAVSKHINLQPETDPLTPSNEELLNEEKIWEQIDALRAIVGYSAPMHATSLEEIRALYTFTGVEPPPSLADNSDVVEMNEKLRLLKAVVGVK